jgi:putative hydrolase of the HAD superfamily
LSDQWDELELAPFFDATVFSCREGTRKPDERLFLAAAERLGVRPGQCLYVGDGGGDEMAGSSAVGMHAVLLAGEDWAEHHAPGRPDAEWTGRRTETLSQIPAIVADLRGRKGRIHRAKRLMSRAWRRRTNSRRQPV